MAKAKKKEALSLEEKLEQALVLVDEQPYKVPENWCWTRIREICEFERGITFPASAKEHELTEENIACLRTANIQEELEVEDLLYVNKSYMKDNEAKLVRKDDIIMSSANSRELVGKASYVYDVNEPMTFGGFVLNIRAKKILTKSLCYMLRYEFLSGRFMGESTQTTNIANINTTTLGNYCFPLPPLAEQQRIVEQIENLFAKLDEAKEKAQCVVDNYDTNRAAVLWKAFNGELTENWRRENDISNTWMTKTIGEVFSVFSGKGFKEKEYSVEGVKLLRISNVTYDTLVWDDVKYLPEKYLAEVPELVLKEDDIVMALNRPITNGKLKISVVDTKEPYILYQRVGCLRQKETNNIEFLRYVLQTRDFLGQVENNLQGSDQPYINIPPLKSLTIRICDIQEQNKVVSILETMLPSLLQAKEAAETTLDQIDLMKKSILAKAFRGELGTNIADEESSIELLKSIIEA